MYIKYKQNMFKKNEIISQNMYILSFYFELSGFQCTIRIIFLYNMNKF